MPIVGILNGYYRTGTTIVWWVLQQSNPDTPIIYEPHSCGVYSEFIHLKPNALTINPLHGLPIYLPYFMVERRLFERYLAVAKPLPVYTKNDLNLALVTIEPFHESEKRCIIQSNQLHPILHEVSWHYRCPYVHIVRDPAEVIYSHAGSPSKLRRRLQELLIAWAPNFMISRWMNHGMCGKFELDYMMRVARLNGWIDGAGDLLEAFVRMYVHYNYEVYENLRKPYGKIVRFEDIVRYPDIVLCDVARHLSLELNSKYTRCFMPSEAFRAPNRLRRAVAKRCDGEIKRMLEELGYEV